MRIAGYRAMVRIVGRWVAPGEGARMGDGRGSGLHMRGVGVVPLISASVSVSVSGGYKVISIARPVEGGGGGSRRGST